MSQRAQDALLILASLVGILLLGTFLGGQLHIHRAVRVAPPTGSAERVRNPSTPHFPSGSAGTPTRAAGSSTDPR